MRFVKRIRCKLFPVGPDFLQHLRVMSVLLSTFNELRLHVIQLVTQLLTHGLTQGIRFTTRKVGQQARQQHHLLLIHCNTIRILQVFLHNRDIVLNRLPAVFTVDEVRNVVHRSRTVKGVHGNQILKRTGLKLTQVLLHTCRFKLEGSDSPPFTVQAVSRRVVNRYFIDIQYDSLTLTNVLNGLLNNGQGLQAQEVHLNQPRIFNYRTFVLGNQHFFPGFLVVCRTHRYPVGNIITTDNRTAGMYTCVSHVTFQHLGIFDGITQHRIRRHFRFLQFRHVSNGIR